MKRFTSRNPPSGWAAALVLGLLAAGGAASRPDGWALGAPGIGAAVLVVAGVAALALGAGATGARPLAGLWAGVLLAVFGPAWPGGGALTGPPALALAAAGAVLALASSPPGFHKTLFLPVVALVFLTTAGRAQRQVGPQGDEPHYLMVADSLLRDHDLALEPDYAEGRYRAFHPAPLEPHYRVRGKDGRIYSLHAVGLSVLILPAYALGGYAAVSFFMALLGVWLAGEVRRLVRAFGLSDALAQGTAWLVALSPPLLHYAGLVFTEVPAALLTAIALRRAREAGSSGRAVLGGALLAALPWLNVRYAVLAVVIFLYAVSREPGPRRLAAWSGVPVLSAAGLALHHFAIYGFFDPRRVYGRRPEIALELLPAGLPGLLLDQEFGLLVYAPVFALAAAGIVHLGRASRRDGLVVAALAVAVLALAGAWPMWRGGFNPPARFLVPVVPALAVAVAARLGRGLGAGPALLAGWGLWTGLAGAWDPGLVHRDRDGTAPLFRRLSGAEEWTRLLPGFVLDESARDRRGLALVWTAALVVAAWPRRRPENGPRTGADLALATAGLAVACAAASLVSTARSEGRDAVRVLGRPAAALPRLRLEARADARWTPGALATPALYEPHRGPVVIGSRLPLPAGEHVIEVTVEWLGGSAAPPTLRALADLGPSGVSTPLRTDGPRLVGVVTVPDGQRATTLLLEGGGAFLLKDLRIASSTFPRNSGLIRGRRAPVRAGFGATVTR